MAPPRGSASYKKKDGTLAIEPNSQSISWTPVAPPGSKPALELPVSIITNLQQTSASSAKVMLKVFTQPAGTSAPDAHVFTFTSPTVARTEADAIRDALSKAIQSAKNGTGANDEGSGSATMTMAATIAAKPRSDDSRELYDDEKLLQNTELQQSLLKMDSSLHKTFLESLRTKPESITTSRFTTQFWSTRTQLLRAHAIEKAQTRGSYNVLSTIKPVTVDNTRKQTISNEQIQLIFDQHPLVRRAYDENVPKLNEETFWSKFFQSRLFKKLKGERITDIDPTDATLDRYLYADEDEDRARRMLAAHIPHIIDIEGNEENNSQRKGNAPDRFMRPTAIDKVPIIRTLNSLSEKILSHVAPNDVDPSEPIGVDEATFNELALRDLQGDAEENRIILKVKDQEHFFHSDRESDISADALQYSKQNPTKVLKSLQAQLKDVSSTTDLSSAIGINDESDASSDEESHTDTDGGHVSSKKSLGAATAQLLSSITQQRLQLDGAGDEETPTPSLSPTIMTRLTLTQSTTTEFLSHFWRAFLSGSPSRADEISKLIETLDRAMSRIQSVANDAEQEREKEKEEWERQAQRYYERTGRKRKLDVNGDVVSGGRESVERLMGPTVAAIQQAGEVYKKALLEQSAPEKDT